MLPERRSNHPLGCYRSRILERIVFEKLLQVLVFDCAHEKIAERSCSATTLRRPRSEWTGLEVLWALREMALEAQDRMVGLETSEVAVGSCITKATCGGEKAGRNPVDCGKWGIEHSAVADGKGIPLGSVSALANRHDPTPLTPTFHALGRSAWCRSAQASVSIRDAHPRSSGRGDGPGTGRRLYQMTPAGSSSTAATAWWANRKDEWSSKRYGSTEGTARC